MLIKENPDFFAPTVSYTTRGPRPGEVHGKQYYFINDEEFTKMIKEDKFLENCFVHGHHYGTAKQELERIAKDQKVHFPLVISIIDMHS